MDKFIENLNKMQEALDREASSEPVRVPILEQILKPKK